MAQWGIARTWRHPIWTPPRSEGFEAGKAAAEKGFTPRERGLIEAIAAFYSTPGSPAVASAGQSCHGPVRVAAGCAGRLSSGLADLSRMFSNAIPSPGGGNAKGIGWGAAAPLKLSIIIKPTGWVSAALGAYDLVWGKFGREEPEWL
jgi:hypothetical protein